MAIKAIALTSKTVKYIGASTDTKPTIASHSGLPEPTVGSTFLEYDTGDLYVTYDGTNWAVKDDAHSTLTSIETAVQLIDNMISGSEAQVDVVGALPAGTNRIGTVSGVLVRVATTKALDATGGAYAANDVLSEDDTAEGGTDWDFDAVGRANGAYGYIVGAIAISESESVTPRLTLFLFNAAPANCELDDNATNTAPDSGDLASVVGKIDFPALESLGTTDSIAVATPSTTGNLPLPFKCAATDDALYGVLVTRDAFTQTGGDDMTIILLVEQY